MWCVSSNLLLVTCTHTHRNVSIFMLALYHMHRCDKSNLPSQCYLPCNACWLSYFKILKFCALEIIELTFVTSIYNVILFNICDEKHLPPTFYFKNSKSVEKLQQHKVHMYPDAPIAILLHLLHRSSPPHSSPLSAFVCVYEFLNTLE